MRLSPTFLASLLVITSSQSLLGSDCCGPTTTVAGGSLPTGYVAASTPVVGPAYVTKYAPSVSTYVDPSSVPPLSANGVYQSQRPAYFDNPSVYTGLPTGVSIPTTVAPTTYESFRTPLNATLRGNAQPASPTFVAPTTYYSAYDGTIPGQPLTVTTPTGTPATAIPATPVSPLYAPSYVAPAPERECCLRRFCRNLFGTSYSTSYYRAPVTYYRPVTSADPVTGAPVIVQQPCTSYEQQVQRTPATTLQFGQPAVPSAPMPSTCPNACTAGPTACPAPLAGPLPSSAGVSDGISQTGALGQTGAIHSPGGVTRIPSVAPPTSSATISPYSPNTQPLTGAPTIAPPPGSSDLSPVNQPRLENNSAPSLPPGNTTSPPSGPVSPQWQLQNADDSTALIRPQATESRSFQDDEENPPSLQRLMGNDNFTRAEPIEAPADYVAPYRRQTFQTPRTTPVTHQGPDTSAAPSFGRDLEASNLTSISSRVPAMQADRHGHSSGRFIRQPLVGPRDNTWTPVRP
jgi:hypothetical protein